MANYDLWLAMARDSYEAGEEAQTAGRLRSAASRFYYAAYQATTALLLYRGLTPPSDREAWAHDDTPLLVLAQTAPVLTQRFQRLEVARRLQTLYFSRLKSDYRAEAQVDANLVGKAKVNAGYILNVVEAVLPERSL